MDFKTLLDSAASFHGHLCGGQNYWLGNGTKTEPCHQCGKCCIAHPCALAPDDVANIARFLSFIRRGIIQSIPSFGLHCRFWREALLPMPRKERRQTRKNCHKDWPLLSSPCVFLSNNRCTIEEVKPRGGRELSCRLMTASNYDLKGYGKKTAARDWTGSPLLNQLFSVAMKNESQTSMLGSNPGHARAF
jgi:Fe-S-cluster containining protein